MEMMISTTVTTTLVVSHDDGDDDDEEEDDDDYDDDDDNDDDDDDDDDGNGCDDGDDTGKAVQLGFFEATGREQVHADIRSSPHAPVQLELPGFLCLRQRAWGLGRVDF